MEKNRLRPITSGKAMRMSFSRQKEVLEMPNLIEVQKDSYQWFLNEGLKEVFDDISPIADYNGRLSLEFVDFALCEDEVKYSIEEAKEIIKTFIEMIKRETTDEEQLKKLEDAIAFRNVSNMPARVKCALLAWHTVEDMLNKNDNTGTGNINCCH